LLQVNPIRQRVFVHSYISKAQEQKKRRND